MSNKTHKVRNPRTNDVNLDDRLVKLGCLIGAVSLFVRGKDQPHKGREIDAIRMHFRQNRHHFHEEAASKFPSKKNHLLCKNALMAIR